MTAGFASKLAPTKSKSAFGLGLPEKHPRAPKRPFRRPSETRAQEVMRHGCRESPAGYRDVPSGRASVAGEFVRVARLHRARMRGKPFWFLFAGVAFHRLTKGTRPRGRNKKHPSTPKRRKHTQTRSLWVPAFAGMTSWSGNQGPKTKPHNPSGRRTANRIHTTSLAQSSDTVMLSSPVSAAPAAGPFGEANTMTAPRPPCRRAGSGAYQDGLCVASAVGCWR